MSPDSIGCIDSTSIQHDASTRHDVVFCESEIILMSVGPDGIDWFEENCPEWREHVSLRRVVARRVEPLPIRPEVIRFSVMPWLHHQLADEIVKLMEPGIKVLDSTPGRVHVRGKW